MSDNQKEKKSGNEKFASFLNKASDLGKKVADNVSEGAKNLSEKAKQDSYDRRMKKYNPLFIKEYKSKNFKLPNIIKIIDDAEIRNIDVCEGAIGYRDTSSGAEILYLIDEFVDNSGITFVPVASCNSIYCVDNFNKTRFINADTIFSKSHEEKIAELEHIAYSLGAKSCSVEIVESDSTITQTNVNIGVNMTAKNSNEEGKERTDNITGNLHGGHSSGLASQRSGTVNSHFSGHNQPTIPVLKWFANEDSIQNLITMRCNDPSSIKSRTLELKGSLSATMSIEAGAAIDAAKGKSAKGKASISVKKQAEKEHNSTLVYVVEF